MGSELISRDEMSMIRRFVTVCVCTLAICMSQMQAATAEKVLYLYSVTIEPSAQADDDTRGDILSDPKRIRIINLGAINHDGVDYAPTISADGKTLYYVSDRKGSKFNVTEGRLSHDFWRTSKAKSQDTTFGEPVNLVEINTTTDEGAASIAADRQTLYFTGCNRPGGIGSCDIWEAKVDGDKFLEPKNLGPNVNSPFWDSQPYIAPDKSRLYFTSNRPFNPKEEDEKDFDIWYCDWDDDLGEWKPARNLGSDVNTKEKESSPFIAADGRTLFFSSNGHLPNIGGLDFYRVRKTGEKDKDGRDRWSKPEALPAPINSKEDDQFMSIPASGDVLYWSSSREDIKGAQGDLDVYMAFIPTFSRAVNLIVNVVDECTGQNIPATIAFKNTATGRTADGSVDIDKTETNVIVGDDDYGTSDDNRAKQVTFTVTASSPAYGERSITVPVDYPGKTVDQNESGVKTEIKKTITLGNRPVLTADMDASDWAKKKNNNFRGLVIEERASIQLYPLLPYVFFDLGKADLPARYKRITSAQTNDFNDERLPGGTLDKYYHVLNIYGYRLRKYPNVNVNIVGCTDETNEDKNSPLPKQRSQVVYDYLKNVWGISESRMKMVARGWPELPSNKKDTNGIVENRRTELVFSGEKEDLWNVQKPIEDRDPTLFPTPATLTFGMKNGIDNNIVASRRVEVFRNGKPWKTVADVGTTDASKVWDWQNEDGEFPSERNPAGGDEYSVAPYKSVLIVTSKNGQECKSDTVTTPVKRVTSVGMGVDKDAVKTLEKYNLILFKFDSPEAGELNERIMSTWVYPRVKKSSVIRIEGHTDIVGLDTRNKTLSEQRAGTAEKFIKNRTKEFTELSTRGTGEEEPLYSNDSPEGRFFNRTVQVIVETPLADAGIE